MIPTDYEDMGREELLAACFGLEAVLNLKEEQLENANKQCEHIMGLYYDMEEQLASSQASVFHLQQVIGDAVFSQSGSPLSDNRSSSGRSLCNNEQIHIDNNKVSINGEEMENIKNTGVQTDDNLFADFYRCDSMRFSRPGGLFVASMENDRPETAIEITNHTAKVSYKEEIITNHKDKSDINSCQNNNNNRKQIFTVEASANKGDEDTIDKNKIASTNADNQTLKVNESNEHRKSFEYFTIDFNDTYTSSKASPSSKTYQPLQYKTNGYEEDNKILTSRLPTKQRSKSPKRRGRYSDQTKSRQLYQSEQPKGSKSEKREQGFLSKSSNQRKESSPCMDNDDDERQRVLYKEDNKYVAGSERKIRRETYDIEEYKSALRQCDAMLNADNDELKLDLTESINTGNQDDHFNIITTQRNLQSALEPCTEKLHVDCITRRPSSAFSAARMRRRQQQRKGQNEHAACKDDQIDLSNTLTDDQSTKIKLDIENEELKQSDLCDSSLANAYSNLMKSWSDEKEIGFVTPRQQGIQRDLYELSKISPTHRRCMDGDDSSHTSQNSAYAESFEDESETKSDNSSNYSIEDNHVIDNELTDIGSLTSSVRPSVRKLGVCSQNTTPRQRNKVDPFYVASCDEVLYRSSWSKARTGSNSKLWNGGSGYPEIYDKQMISSSNDLTKNKQFI